MLKHTITFNYTAPYYAAGNPEADHLWMVMHGYGQLAEYFIRKFSFLEGEALIIAPEGLSNFYLQGVSGRVGATWMTKQHREIAIQNYISYLSSVYETVLSKHERPFQKVTMLGFSQGVATLLRWLSAYRPEFDQLMMCAGGFPADLDREVCRRLFAAKDCHYLYGNKDEYIREDSIPKLKAAFADYGLQVRFTEFEGKHEVHQPSLEAITKKGR